MEKQPKPYVTAAFFCERILQEKDGLVSAIRIIDRINYVLPAEAIPSAETLMIQISGFISLKSGPAKGTATLKMNTEWPSGMREEGVITSPIDLKGGDNGQNLIVNISLGIKEEGLVWFEVTLDDEILTKIPIMIVNVGQQASGNIPIPSN